MKSSAQVLGGLMQIPGPGNLGSQNGFKTFPILMPQDTVIQHAGRMNDASKWRAIIPDGIQDPIDIIPPSSRPRP